MYLLAKKNQTKNSQQPQKEQKTPTNNNSEGLFLFWILYHAILLFYFNDLTGCSWILCVGGNI